MDEVVTATAQLEKKATFEAGLRALLQLAERGAHPPAALLPAAQRAHALLKARYSNPAWLKLGGRLFAALLAPEPAGGAPPLAGGARGKAEACASGIRQLLGDEADEAGEASGGGGGAPGAPRERTLGEMLGLPPARPAASHLSDAGLVLDHAPAANGAYSGGGGGGGGAAAAQLLQLLGMQAGGAQPQQGGSEDGDGREEPREGGGEGSGQRREQQQEQEQEQQRQGQGAEQSEQGGPAAAAPHLPELTDLASLQALLSQLLAHHAAAGGGGGGAGDANGAGAVAAAAAAGGGGGGAGVLGGMSADAMMEELEVMLATIASEAGAHQPPSRPPASRKAVASLPVATIGAAEAAAAAAAGDKCPVCCCEWAEGEEQQRLPCGHAFHPGCNAPWLAQHNSCAVCRHELPTDDHAYEAHKERERQAEEDRRGAENALSHNEFMYM